MTAGDCRLKLALDKTMDGILADAAHSRKVDNADMMHEYTDLASDAARMVSHSNSGGYLINFDSFANYSLSLESNTKHMNVLIPARYSSLETLSIIIRNHENIGAVAKIRYQSK